MPRPNVSRTLQSYLQLLTEQTYHYATLRLFGGLELAARGRLCLDAQVPALISLECNECACSLVVLASYRKDGAYHQELLQFEGHYDPNEVLGLGPARWGQLADTLAYQLISQLVQWKKDKEVATFSYLAATTGLKPDRQRFYL
ncbi:MAG: hypothetical protein DPW09_36160 [Anaerolineae bacterium]|nr:hypothetical protein [Anaerolineales bacterium]MCQ3978889.1 hypothetical protein [Anaerolineae bacterium]